MDLLKNNKTIVGLFDNDKYMEEAITKLQEQGFGKDNEKFHIIDEAHLKQQAPAVTPTPTIPSGQPHAGTVPVSNVDDLMPGEDNTPVRIERSVYDMLTDLGLEEAEATFYARHVARGSSLVVLKTDQEHASKAIGIMEQFDARTVKA